MQRCLTVLLLLALCLVVAFAQTAPVDAMRENTPKVFALTNARIVVAPGNVIAKGTLVVRNGTIQAVGANVQSPADARVFDLTGYTLYAGLIELSSDIGAPKPPPQSGPQQQADTLKGSAHWNRKIRAELDIAQEFSPDDKAAEKLRSQGFTLALSTPQRGIFRGYSALVQLGDGTASELIAKRNVAQNVTFEVTGGFFGGYPNSLMGVVAMIRQTWMDADWYRKAWDSYNKNPNQSRPETNNSLAALQDALQRRQTVMFQADDERALLRAAKIGKEFSLNLIIRGSGNEYKRLDAVKATKLPVVVPLNFPEAPDVDTPEEAVNATLETLRHWDAAPENAGRLEKAGVSIALTSATLKDAGTFLAQVRKAIERGLSTDAALAALTTTPAKWIGVEKNYGTLEAGKVANIVVTDGDLFAEKTKIREVWVDGKQYEVKPPPATDARGTWELMAFVDGQNQTATLKVAGEAEKPSGSVEWNGKSLKLNSPTFSAGRLAFTLATDSVGLKGSTQMSGSVSASEMYGIGNLPDGSAFSWSATRKEPAKAESDTSKPKEIHMASFADVYPPGAYGRTKQPDQPANVLFKNATVWTQGPQGKLEGTDVLVTRGKITRIGKNLQAPSDAVIVDATGKHMTPGMIDAHSHTAADGSVNEGAQNVTIETSIEDVIDSDDIWIYRQLAGGTTAANILHGSANPIGGRNATVKWRWGALPDEYLLAGAPPGVKFALGENVKGSNFNPPGGQQTPYPATRMGVEQIIRDKFKAARDYQQAWKDWERDKSNIPPRKDIELDAVSEILSGKRLVHCHSYRQDEILMMIRIADDFGFRIGTFQHVLEGYKVADAIAKHGAGASSFSDWWAYKIEAWEAIPGNGPLMAAQGVVVSYNSDNSQLATRLNWEAAKAIPFGVSEEEALKFVTINPAKQLGIADKVGSLEVGKDADIAVWNGNPLSTYTKCVQTWVDGRRYFDIDEDKQMRETVQHERAALIQKVLASKGSAPASAASRRPAMSSRPNDNHFHTCDESAEIHMEGYYNEN
ncbi:MAG: amidohydrolase family protein [Ignavibacteriae bacterium]|nr:amidohydrolase family protein [Ignavibacteriota bacterium]